MIFSRADKLTFDPREQLSCVFVEGFYDWLKRFCPDKDKLTAAFAHMFRLEYFFVAFAEKKSEDSSCENSQCQIAAMASCTGGFSPTAILRKEFTRVLGFFRGNFTYYVLRRQMTRNGHPFVMSKTTGYIEFVATAPQYRHQGYGHALLSYLITENPYKAYILEVADTNINAVALYEKLGFKEMRRVKAPRKSGVDFFIYMRRENPLFEKSGAKTLTFL